MCLTLDKCQEIKTAEKDITCYKVIAHTSFWNDYSGRWCTKFLTPCRDMEVDRYIIRGGEKFTPAYRLSQSFYEGSIEGGFIHTYRYLSGAQALLTRCETNIKDLPRPRNYFKHYVIYECVIPKGEQYLEGSDGITYCHAYASTAIKFIKPIDEEK